MGKKVMVICGFGSGISQAVAERFGAEGFELVLVARTRSRLDEAVAALAKKGITAHARPADLADPEATRALIAGIESSVGPVTVYHWNAVHADGDLLKASVDDLTAGFNVGITSLVAGLAPAVAQMRGQPGAAILVTGGAFSRYDDSIDSVIANANLIGLAVTKAAQHKLVRTLSRRLGRDGIFVGEVMVKDAVKGSAGDRGTATLAPATVAKAFWDLYTTRASSLVAVP